MAWVGLGSNLGDNEAHIKRAFAQLDAAAHTQCKRISSLYRSAPIGPQDQADFCNAVAQLTTELSALELLDWLLQLEASHQRKRSRRWGPRSLDLDLLLYDDQRHNSATLTLPHPRLHERAFVLVPLAELAPTLEIPGLGGVAQLLERVKNQDISLWQTQ